MIRRSSPDGAAAQPQRGDEALLAEPAGVQRRAQLAEHLAVLLGDLLLGGVEQDQVARAPVCRRHPHVLLARLRVEPVERDHDGLALGEPLGGRGVDERPCLPLDLLGADAAREQPRTLPIASSAPGSASTRAQNASAAPGRG